MAQVEHLEAGTNGSVSALETHTTKYEFAFSQGEVSVVDHSWECSTSDLWHSEDYFLNVTVSGRTGPAFASYLDGNWGISERIGRIMVVPPGNTVRSGGCVGSQRNILCVLRPEAVNELLKHAPTWSKASLLEGLHLNSPEVEWFLMKIHDELARPGFAQGVMIDSLASSLAVAIVRAFHLQDDGDRRNIGGLAPWRMRLLRERIHSDEPLPQLSELAELCDMSVRQLTRAFRVEMNITVAKYVENAMVERARILLATSQSIGEVASLLGFSGSSSFAYAFRRATGMLPSDLRHYA
ncbi:MAG TPA: helix-turn-helix domain-containing protein [Sphingobium sp.]|uniref:helix-turn-helix domain-containing protein n=1 Tax=Sphingobium sp. TaxID=1912891 RepID=UPI002ED3749C